jgi:hypothetical protein
VGDAKKACSGGWSQPFLIGPRGSVNAEYYYQGASAIGQFIVGNPPLSKALRNARSSEHRKIAKDVCKNDLSHLGGKTFNCYFLYRNAQPSFDVVITPF